MKKSLAKDVRVDDVLIVERIVEVMVHEYGIPEDLILEDFGGEIPDCVRVVKVSPGQEDTIDFILENVTEPYSFEPDVVLFLQDGGRSVADRVEDAADLVELIEIVRFQLKLLAKSLREFID